ncbi:DUF4293 domain-containing protein [Bacteroidota bacterium]
MLQRIQTLYLLAVFVFAILLLTGPLAFITQEEGGLNLHHSGLFDLSGEKLELSSWPLTVMILLSVITSFFSIFLYKNRVRQMRFTLFQMFFNLGIIVIIYYYVRYTMHNYEGIAFVLQWRIVIPLIMLILLVLAFRGIRKDEILVKAADRLR